jgi:2-succinyl-5-enolpyruvyl-6-hydroxy-3-cyclohexene-1-carboxylate synthase
LKLQTTDKKSVQQLSEILWQKGVRHIIISPGSRNAPLILAFSSHPEYECISVPDERSAAFVALGIAEQTQQPVALVCSSGSALLNYYPAISEAFFRHIPLVVLSADRPEYLIDQGDGQTIHQQRVFGNHILYQAQLEENPQTEKEIWFNYRKINEALIVANEKVIAQPGPVHLNIPLEEPLYSKKEAPIPSGQITVSVPGRIVLTSEEVEEIASIWKRAKKRMLIIGQFPPNAHVVEELQNWSEDILVLTETTSNQNSPNVIQCIDRLLIPMSEQEKRHFQPDLLLTFGGQVVSKKIKNYLREYSPKYHIHIGPELIPSDTYQCLTHHIRSTPNDFLNQLRQHIAPTPNPWVADWLKTAAVRREHHDEFMHAVSYSDLSVMESVNRHIPQKAFVHLANSTPIRYALLFNWHESISFTANRGTSGIDGIVSTAMGAALSTNNPVYLIVGDISFFYDSNAWWHNQIPSNLKVLVINNSGGGIFRFIEGPNSTGQLERFFETQQKNSVEHIAGAFGLNYLCATDKSSLEEKLKIWSDSAVTSILEVCTPRLKNAEILHSYFGYLKSK